MTGVIFTGGTIGSSVNGDYISTDSAKSYKLISMYEKKYGREDFLTDRPCEILSENITCRDYEVIVGAVQKMMEAYVDGIILTHGSDTIQYTAALLSYVIRADIPIMIVCSNYVLEDDRANGMKNFRAAVDFIKNKYGKGIFVPYAGADGITRIFYGNNILKHDIYSDELRALGDAYYGYYEGESFTECKKDNPCIVNVTYSLPVQLTEFSDVLVINPYPGMKYPDPEGYKAVLHTTYHSGTICTKNEDLYAFAKKAKEKNIPVYLLGTNDGTEYESCKEYKKFGFISLPHMTEISAYIEIWLTNN